MLCASTSYPPADQMSFLSELKKHATELQSRQLGVQQDLSTNTQNCEFACKMARKYLQELCAQLNVIRPPAPGDYSLNGKQPFPPLALANLRCDARTKMLRNAEAIDYIGMGWDLLPAKGSVAVHSVTVNFPPDLERVTSRLSVGKVPHERKEQRHPETNKLLAYVFEYETQTRGFITVTPDHDRGEIAFRISNVGGFGVENTTYPAAQVTPGLMDELAKKLVGQASRFG